MSDASVTFAVDSTLRTIARRSAGCPLDSSGPHPSMIRAEYWGCVVDEPTGMSSVMYPVPEPAWVMLFRATAMFACVTSASFAATLIAIAVSREPTGMISWSTSRSV